MKQICYLALTFIILVYGQVKAQSVEDHKLSSNQYLLNPKTEKSIGEYSQRSTVIAQWSFSNASNWSAGYIGGADQVTWQIGQIPPSGPFAIGAIQSTTAQNGWAIFDSDLFCGGNQNAWLQIANPINLTGVLGVKLRFETFYKEFQGDCYIETSTDGQNWVNTQEVLNVGLNNVTYNPQIVEVNLCGLAGSSTAYFRFRYEGGCDYAWMIDDVKLVTTPANDLELTNARFGNCTRDPVFGQHIPYTIIPQSQIDTAGIAFYGNIENQGYNNQSNLDFNVAILDDQLNIEDVLNSSSYGDSLMACNAINDTTSCFQMPINAMQYDAVYQVNYDDYSQDDNVSDNWDTLEFEVGNQVYARDLNRFTSSGLWNGEENGTANPYILGPLFEIKSSVELHSLDVALTANTTPQSIIFPMIIQVNPNATSFQDYFVNVVYDGSQVPNGEHTVMAGDIPTGNSIVWTSLPIIDGVELLAGNDYVFGVSSLGGGYPAVIMNGNGYAPKSTNFLYDGNGSNDANGQPKWYWVSSTSAVRGRFNPDGLESHGQLFSEIKAYPNPANELLNIRFQYTSNSQARSGLVQILDITGRKIKEKAVQLSTENQVQLDLNGLGNGVYLFRLLTEGHQQTKRFIIQK